MASDGSDIFIWWISGSIRCWRVMITLQEKQLTKHGEKLLLMSKNEQNSEEVLAVNPRGQAPAMKHGDKIINESLAACMYLEDVFKKQGTQLIPDDLAAKALVLQRFIEAPINFIRKFVYVWILSGKSDGEELKKRKKAVADELRRWEGYLAQMGEGSYIAGKEFSLADASFFPFLGYFERQGLSFDCPQIPKLKAYYERLKERPSIQKTWPQYWKESTGEDLFKGILDL